jgi:hypothetical protein
VNKPRREQTLLRSASFDKNETAINGELIGAEREGLGGTQRVGLLAGSAAPQSLGRREGGGRGSLLADDHLVLGSDGHVGLRDLHCVCVVCVVCVCVAYCVVCVVCGVIECV